MLMYHNIVREELHEMIGWYIGSTTDFRVSVGKTGKYLAEHFGYTYNKQEEEHMRWYIMNVKNKVYE